MSDQKDLYNRGGMIAFVFSMVFVISFFIYLVTLHPGVDLGENVRDPKALAALEGQASAVDISKVTEPWLENPDMIAHGQKLYKTNCAMCHGNTGAGDGTAGGALIPRPRNLIEGKWTKGGDSIALFNTLTDGIAGTSMAGYGHLSAADRWGMVQYIRSITKNKTKDDEAKLKAFAQSAK